jgi:ribose transport system substrate-binding protein
MGAMGIETVMNSLQGKKVQKSLNTGVVIVTKDNIDSPEAKNVLY